MSTAEQSALTRLFRALVHACTWRHMSLRRRVAVSLVLVGVMVGGAGLAVGGGIAAALSSMVRYAMASEPLVSDTPLPPNR